MLKNTLLSNPSTTCIVIQDDNSIKGTELFRAILKHDAESDAVKDIHLISCENPPEYYLECVNSAKVTVHNLFQDPNCWLQKNEFECTTLLDRILNSNYTSSTVMIDSINFLIILENVNYVCSTIHKLKRLFKKVTCLLHIDETTCIDTMKKFMFLSHVYLKLYANKSKIFHHTMDNRKSKLVDGIHMKDNGKVISFKEIFFVDDDFHLHSQVYHGVQKNSSRSNIKDTLKNITTFRLGLDMMENEKKARDNLVLPYLRSTNKARLEGGGGEIVYYAESGDDLEEDPDDDLDI